MKNLIIKALDGAYVKLLRSIPQTKRETRYMSLNDVSPQNTGNFMKDNNIPDDAWYGGWDNGDDGYDDIGLCWYVEVPTTDKDKLDYCNKAFERYAWKAIYDSFISEDYKRVGFNSSLLNDFKDTTIYGMYMDKDYDRLFDYYSLYFKK